MKKILYINDYACSPQAFLDVKSGTYPECHLWGMVEYIDSHSNINFKYCNPNDYPFNYSFGKKYSRYLNQFVHLIKWILIFLKNANCDIIYSALPGYDIGFLLAKKLGFKPYKVLTVVHHPSSRLILKNMYDKIIFISKTCHEQYKGYSNTEYIFWGPDLKFYNQIETNTIKKQIDFISAGKTLRDYATLRRALSKLNANYIIIGENDARNNEISYFELLKLYSQSKFIVIPMKKLKKDNNLINGLTSFIDALGMGLPVIMSDNSNLGIDIEKEGIGFSYAAGDTDGLVRKLAKCLEMDEVEYEEMYEKCRLFACKNSFDIFSKSINTFIEHQLCQD